MNEYSATKVRLHMLLQYAAYILAFYVWGLQENGIAQIAETPQSGDKRKVDGFEYSLPRIPPQEPNEAIKSFEILPGYAIELVASEPLVRDPVAMSFDADGRLYVVEMCDYSEQADEHLGAIRLLTDSDGDGKFDSEELFVEGLSWPTAIICYDGGVFIGAAPDIWYCKDTNNDGRADIKQKVFTGFGRSNVQGLLNSFVWGIDNRIWGQTSSSGGSVVRVANDSALPGITLSGRDFSFDPRALDLREEVGGAQHGMSFDDYGHRFASHNSDHLQQFVYSAQHSSREVGETMPPSRQSIAVDGPQAEVFRISPVEPWRILRTHLRVSKKVPGPVEGGGRAAGYFTGATGATVYRGDAMPELVGQVFVGDVGSNIVHRKRLVDTGIVYRGERIDANREFLASRDIWFRPAQFANAPDGALYIADVYREVIEHPASLPPEIKQHLDLTSGRDRGRIYRIVHSGHQQKRATGLSTASIETIVSRLESANGWDRDTASRLLIERNDKKATPLLVQMLTGSMNPKSRIHAMRTLESLGELTIDALLSKLQDTDPFVREAAASIASERFHAGNVRSESEQSRVAISALSHAIADLLRDENPRVRFTAALALSQWARDRSDEYVSKAVIAMLEKDSRDAWLMPAALRCLDGTGAFQALVVMADTAGADAATELMAQVVSRRTVEYREKLESWFERNSNPVNQQAMFRGLLKASLSVKRDKALTEELRPYPRLMKGIDELIASLKQQLNDGGHDVEQRLAALGALNGYDDEELFAIRTRLLASSVPLSLQLGAVRSLGMIVRDDVAELLIDSWSRGVPSVRSAIVRELIARPSWTERLLAAIEAERIIWTEIDPATQSALRGGRTSGVAERVAAIDARYRRNNGTRSEVYEQYKPALERTGRPEIGKVLFQKHCAACHRLENVGQELGPNLAAFKFRGADAILVNVLDPNREVNPQYISYTAVTTDERIVNGMILNETGSSITFTRGENNQEVIQLSDIQQLKSSQKSIMPEGFEQQFDHQAMADLLSYIMAQP